MLHARPDYNRFQDPEHKIAADEPVILFRAQDSFMPLVLVRYLELLKANGAADNIQQAVHTHINTTLEWQRRNGSKLPDM